MIRKLRIGEGMEGQGIGGYTIGSNKKPEKNTSKVHQNSMGSDKNGLLFGTAVCICMKQYILI